MKAIRGPLVLAVLLLAAFGAFVAWYGGSGGEPMTRQQFDTWYVRAMRDARASDTMAVAEGRMLEHMRKLVDSDDGGEFVMVYLLRFKEHAVTGDAAEADRRNNRRVAPLLLRHGSFPIFVGEPQGRFIDETGAVEWQRVVMVRYRSRRDMLALFADLIGSPVGILRWASIENAQIFPVKASFSLLLVKGVVFTALAWLGLLVHLVLRRWSWYRGTPASEGTAEPVLA